MKKSIVLRVVLALLVHLIGLAAVPCVAGRHAERPDIEALVQDRGSERLLARVKRSRLPAVEEQMPALVYSHTRVALDLNAALYGNPAVQAWINSLGHSLMPPDLPDDRLVVFKVFEDPTPQAYVLATGSVFISTGFVAMADNEAQLAYLLAHQGSHVLLNHPLQAVIDRVNRAARAKNAAAIAAAFAGLAAAAAANNNNATGGETVATAAGAAALAAGVSTSISEGYRSTRFDKKAQQEADEVALELMLRAGYDPREGLEVLRRARKILSAGRATVTWMSFASQRRFLDRRMENVSALLNQVYRPLVESGAGGTFRVSSPVFNQMMGQLKRDAGIAAFRRDLFGLARTHLEEAHQLLGEDPLTLYHLGLVARAVARTPAERDAALQWFRAALHADRYRGRLPRAWLEYAVELADRGDLESAPEIVASLENYVRTYQKWSGGGLPPDIGFVYETLSRFGEERWAAYPVLPVNPGLPVVEEGVPAGRAEGPLSAVDQENGR